MRITNYLSVYLLMCALPLLALNATAQDNFEYWPDPDYDPAIPTIEDVLGYAPGEQITWHRDAIRYFQALQAAAPERMTITEYARSWQGRELIYAVVSAPENIANLESVKSGMQSLADPRQTDDAAAAEIIASQPAVTWLSYGVHGNEISSTDASMLTAYHLLASRGDARVADIMDDTVVSSTPCKILMVATVLFTSSPPPWVWSRTLIACRLSMTNPGLVVALTTICLI